MTNKLKTLPWYKEGLRFQCTGCGKCCSGSPGYVWISEVEIEAAAKFLNISVEMFKRKYIRQRYNRFALTEIKAVNNEYDCVFLKDKKCTIYPVRPKQCQTFPWWKQNLNSEESWNLAAKDCEGIHADAPVVPYDEIEKQLQCNDPNF